MPINRIARPLVAVGVLAGIFAISTGASRGSSPATDDSDLTFTGSILAARTASVEHDLDAAARFLGFALKSDPDNPQLMQRTLELRVINGDIDNAVPLAVKLLASKNDTGFPSQLVGIKAIKDGNFAKAEGILKAHQPNDVASLLSGLLLAWAQQGLNHTDDALATIDGLKDDDSYAIFKNYHRGLIAELAGRTEDATRWMKAAFDANGGGLRMVEGYARLAARSGDVAGAKKALEDLAAQSNNHPVVKELLDDLGAGRPLPPLIHNAQDGAAEALYSLGAALVGDSNSNLPPIYLELALYLNPKDELALLTLGDMRQGSDDFQKAIDAFGKIRETSPLYQAAMIDSSLSLDALDRTDEAANKLNALLKADPNNLAAALALGDIYRGHKRFSESADAYSIGIASLVQPGKSDWRLFYSRGIAYERTKRWPEAEADFRKALELNPDQPQVLNYLGYSLVDKRMKLDEALGMIRKAVDLRPDDAYIVDSLGWAYFQLGKVDDAVTELERAIQLQPEDPVINDHLGDAYWKTGRKLEATFQWTHARDLKPEDDQLPTILAKLKSGLDPKPTPPTPSRTEATPPAGTPQRADAASDSKDAPVQAPAETP